MKASILLLIALMLLTSSCGKYVDACDAVENSDFKSVTVSECGPNSSCSWWLLFTGKDRWSRIGSDYGLGGTYTCSGNILKLDAGGTSFGDAVYQPKTDQLSWNGLVFVRSSRN